MFCNKFGATEGKAFTETQDSQLVDDDSRSDAPTDDGEVAAYMLPCYGHLADENSMDEADEDAKISMRRRTSGRKSRVVGNKTTGASAVALPTQAFDVEEEEEANALCSTMMQADAARRLVSQNARLALENKRLREQCEKAAAAAQAAAAAAEAAAGLQALTPHSNKSSSVSTETPMAEELSVSSFSCGTSSTPVDKQSMMSPSGPQMMVSQPYMGQWWSPVQMPFNMQGAAPMMMPACFVVPAQGNSQQQQQQQTQQNKLRRGVNSNKTSANSRQDADAGVEMDCPLEERTTVMLRNMPNNYNRKMLLQMLDSEGFGGQYNFVYMPIDFKSKASLGYAFINMVSPEVAQRFWAVFDGYSNWVLPSRKSSKVSWSSPHQGLQAHVERYKNSPLMHADVPDDYRPILLIDGVRAPFPEPTKRLRAPRLRHSPVERLPGAGAFYPTNANGVGGQAQNRSRHAFWEAQKSGMDCMEMEEMVQQDSAILTDEEDFWF
mmetsp:Transcript_50031/g.119033  ORF Transcript_50031/g.119033 Transcript_50031/m.119033 type:complete len:493 (+) Transcript_50031:127-1605(+)